MGVVQPAGGRVPAADGPQLTGLARHELADAHHLGAGSEQLCERTGLEPHGQPADEAHDEPSPSNETHGRGEHHRSRAMTMPGDGRRDDRHRDPHLGVDDVGEVVDDTGEHVGPRRRPSRAGVSGTRAS